MLRSVPSFRRDSSPRDSRVTGTACTPTSDDAAERSRLALMSRIEASLDAGLRALLVLDLSGIEGRTKEQVFLCGELAAVLNHSFQAVKPAGSASGLSQEMQRTGFRILEALRLQSAVLQRSQAKLRVMANMMADPSAAYARPQAFRGSGAHTNGMQIPKGRRE